MQRSRSISVSTEAVLLALTLRMTAVRIAWGMHFARLVAMARHPSWQTNQGHSAAVQHSQWNVTSICPRSTRICPSNDLKLGTTKSSWTLKNIYKITKWHKNGITLIKHHLGFKMVLIILAFGEVAWPLCGPADSIRFRCIALSRQADLLPGSSRANQEDWMNAVGCLNSLNCSW